MARSINNLGYKNCGAVRACLDFAGGGFQKRRSSGPDRRKSCYGHVTELVKIGKVAIVGAVYDIKTGVVDVRS